LQQTWPAAIQGGAGIIKPLEEVQTERYYFMDDVLTAPDGCKYVVCNQWGASNFENFIKLAASLGYPVESNSSVEGSILTPTESNNIEEKTTSDDEITQSADQVLAVLKFRKYIEEDFTRNNFYPTFRDLIFSVPSENRNDFINALKELTKENAIPFLKVGFDLCLQDWSSDDDELNDFISTINSVIINYEPSLFEYVASRKDMMFAVSNACISYNIAFDTLANIETKLFLFGLRAAGFENINELDDPVKIGKFKHTVCSVFYHIFSRLDMDDEYNSVEKLCHFLTATIDDFIEGFTLERGILMHCLGQVLWARYQINFGQYISDSEVYDFESKDYWGFDFEYPVDFRRLAGDILKLEGYQI